jgi:predicted N-acetyltransferase YhbS
MTIQYAIEPELSAAEFIDVLQRSTLAQRRPIDQPEVIRGMLENASLIVTARDGGRLVGVSRAITDFFYCTYLSDLAVDEAHQRRGIGRELIRQTHLAAGLQTSLILLAAPKARTYYGHIGMTAHDSCWYIARTTGDQPKPDGTATQRHADL